MKSFLSSQRCCLNPIPSSPGRTAGGAQQNSSISACNYHSGGFLCVADGVTWHFCQHSVYSRDISDAVLGTSHGGPLRNKVANLANSVLNLASMKPDPMLC